MRRGPLIHLDELACLDLLADFPAVLVPAEVWREVQRHRPSALGQPVVTLRQLTPTQPVPPALAAMPRLLALHAGEMEAHRVALEHDPARLLTDCVDSLGDPYATITAIPYRSGLSDESQLHSRPPPGER